jgi:outer membrane receptor for ferrienterochelin and colicin
MRVSLSDNNESHDSFADRLAGTALRSSVACVLLFLGRAARTSIAAADGVKTLIGRMRSLAKVTNPNSTTADTASNSLFDLFRDWKVNDHISVNGGVNNLLDRDPPIMGGVSGTTEPSTYDILGRTFYLGARVKL